MSLSRCNAGGRVVELEGVRAFVRPVYQIGFMRNGAEWPMVVSFDSGNGLWLSMCIARVPY